MGSCCSIHKKRVDVLETGTDHRSVCGRSRIPQMTIFRPTFDLPRSASYLPAARTNSQKREDQRLCQRRSFTGSSRVFLEQPLSPLFIGPSKAHTKSEDDSSSREVENHENEREEKNLTPSEIDEIIAECDSAMNASSSSLHSFPSASDTSRSSVVMQPPFVDDASTIQQSVPTTPIADSKAFFLCAPKEEDSSQMIPTLQVDDEKVSRQTSYPDVVESTLLPSSPSQTKRTMRDNIRILRKVAGDDTERYEKSQSELHALIGECVDDPVVNMSYSESWQCDGSTRCDDGGFKCYVCDEILPRSEFTKYQLRQENKRCCGACVKKLLKLQRE